jgi:hypothetical protein
MKLSANWLEEESFTKQIFYIIQPSFNLKVWQKSTNRWFHGDNGFNANEVLLGSCRTGPTGNSFYVDTNKTSANFFFWNEDFDQNIESEEAVPPLMPWTNGPLCKYRKRVLEVWDWWWTRGFNIFVGLRWLNNDKNKLETRKRVSQILLLLDILREVNIYICGA